MFRNYKIYHENYHCGLDMSLPFQHLLSNQALWWYINVVKIDFALTIVCSVYDKNSLNSKTNRWECRVLLVNCYLFLVPMYTIYHLSISLCRPTKSPFPNQIFLHPIHLPRLHILWDWKFTSYKYLSFYNISAIC